MDNLEKKLRDKFIKIIRTVFIVECIVNILFCIMFYIKDAMYVSFEVYVMKYVLLPISVNFIIYFISNRINLSDRYDNDYKNFACSIALCTIAGSLSIFHSCYPPIWVGPGITLLFCSVFHNKKIQKHMLIYSCVFVVISCIYIGTEGTLKPSYLFEQCMVTEIITILCGFVAKEVVSHQENMLSIVTSSLKNEEEYRNRLEIDSLTKVHSRVYMDELINRLFNENKKDENIGIAILDLDNFKKINDVYGHDNGDIVLQTLGKILNENITENEEVGRFGGEEFIIIFKNNLLTSNYELIDKIRKKLNEYTFDFMEEHISFSAGIIQCEPNMTYEEAFKLVDKTLYKAKENGKNRVIIYEK